MDVPSVSHHEAELAAYIEHRLRALPHLEVVRVGDNVVARTRLGRPQRVVLAGHLDTVPPNGNERARIEADSVAGLGSADMKGGLAVMLTLAAVIDEPPIDTTFVFYVAEEVARTHNGLLQIEADRPDLLSADAAILGEPTGACIEAGCQGVLRLELEMGGARAHTARPWMGVNALHRLAPILERLTHYPERRPIIDGCEYHEVVSAVKVEGGVAGNVVPDKSSLVVNHRFAPDRDPVAAEKALRMWLEPILDPALGDRLEVVDCSPAAAPNLGHPLLAALLEVTGRPARAKLGWTDVSFFAERGISAVNFGPGDPELAHTAGERVTGAELEQAYRCLRSVLIAGE